MQLLVRRMLYQALEEAFAMTSLPWERCYREDRGDGALIVAPPDVPAYLFMDPLAHHLAAVLRYGNRLTSDLTRLQVRLAAHVGLVHCDVHGVTGRALNHLFRLIEADAFKSLLAARGSDIGLIVSDQLYTEVTGEGGLVNADAYQALECETKETKARAWTWFPS
ncbi:hypothetical protein [Actinomadura sp. 6N118]|uniref:hypothetical protein n=1 Tax=Actinomadura sp. 6N118 TaxID=3375151 RepID=UPI00379D557B